MKKPHTPKLVLIEFGILDEDKHVFAFFEGREQVKLATTPNEVLSHQGTIDVLKEYFKNKK